VKDAIDRLRLVRTEGVGGITYRRLLARYGSAAAALDVLPGLARAGGKPGTLAIPTHSEAEREMQLLARIGGAMLFLGGPDYPPLLAMLENAPPVLAVLGSPKALSARAVAVVGGRNASINGRRIAESLGRELAAAGLVVVSGLARGIDGAAHSGALQTGRTVACVAGGLDLPYPPEHAELQGRVAEGGAVVSEAPLGTAPMSRHFPRRNRIIAGLSLGVVVVEAALRSGSLLTARLGLEAGREVFAVPGSPLDPRCQGSNDLIRQGAHLTESAADILEYLPDQPRGDLLAGKRSGLAEGQEDVDEAIPERALAQARTQVLDLLSPSPTSVDDLIRRCQFSAPAIMAVLLELELAGRLTALPGNRVALLAHTGP
jgi:DNA processing protein